jgi:hypothetical protein
MESASAETRAETRRGFQELSGKVMLFFSCSEAMQEVYNGNPAKLDERLIQHSRSRSS